jgi:pimeloyl-ACP methyl ester carboxylesterase
LAGNVKEATVGKIETMEGVTSQMVQTKRLRQHVLTTGNPNGRAVIFLHGNFAAATYWEETMLALPKAYRGVAPDLRGYGWTEDQAIDATGGVRDWVQDLEELLPALGAAKIHLVGWSLGAAVVYRFIADHAAQVKSATLVAPVSPYGFGATKEADGAPCYPDFAGSGGGMVNLDFTKRIQAEDRSADDPNSPRNVINAFYYKAPFRAVREETFLTASLMEKTGPQRYPGDYVPSPNWPNVAPGAWGPINAGSPKYVQGDARALVAAKPKPPVLWVRGSHDQIVSDNSLFEFGTLGKLGIVPGWPGEDVFPPQPMVSQTRAVLEHYVAAGGAYEEHVIEETAHGPHIQSPEAFNQVFHRFLEQAERS